MKQKDIKPLKEKLWLKNDKKCPLLNIDIPLERMTLDHIHKLKSEHPSEQKGTIRNAIEFRANSMEGKITNNWKRYFSSDETKHPITLPNFLRNLADYLENGAYIENNTVFIHPTEVKKEPNLSKSNYNRCKKLYNEDTEKKTKKKFPNYPNLKRCTKELDILFKKYNVPKYNF